MSKILATRVKTHIEASIRDVLDVSDCVGDDQKVLSRGLVAICLASISGLPYKDVAKYVTDGYKDNGIDGCYYDPNKNRLFLIQSKWSSAGTKTIDTGDLHKFVQGAYELLDLNWKNFNPRFSAIAAEIEAGLKNDPGIVLVATFNSENPLSEDCRRILDKFLSENNTNDQEVVAYSVFNITDIVRAIKSSKSGIKTDVDLSLLDWGEHKDPYYAIYGRISCADVAEWHKAHGELLFSENIRYTLSSSDINARIAESLTERPSTFWYLNNGITAICDEIKRKPVGLGDQRESSLWSVSNIKIVNGAQTTSAIANAYKSAPQKVKKGYIQLKIVSIGKAPLDIGNQITTATNTQNRVEPRDFLALDTVQDGLAEAFRKIGVQYCYRRGEVISDLAKGLDVQELALSLAATSKNITDVVMAKRNVGSLTDPAGYYQKLFSPVPDASKAWKNCQLWRKAQKVVQELADAKSDREKQLATHGNRFIENRLVLNHSGSIDAATVEKLHNALLVIINDKFKDCYLAVLFKNAQKCEVLSQELTAVGL
ncbi:AIPR family protein [Solimonas variicoloris]|uniref:AIPR family protein n=1 Tax=Solimonas variicoloris TaxID=254408 RepID=UPI00039CF7AA|nr:AIPR family protein [Solimonas variicoloris]